MDKQNKDTKRVKLSYVKQLYIIENYSMELLAKTIKFPLPELSRLLWKYDLPEEKKKYYESMGGIPREKNKPSDIKKDTNTNLFYQKYSEKALEEEFLNQI